MSYSRERPAEYQVLESAREYRETHYKPLRLKQLAEECWKLKIPGFVLVAVLAATGIAIGIVRPPTYKATVVMSPASETTAAIGGGTSSSLVSQVQGLASLAGLGGAGDQKKWDSLAVLQSEELTDSFITKYDLLPVLFSAKWDADRRAWKASSQGRHPDLWNGYMFFSKKVRTIVTDARTGIITLTIVWRDPKVAAAWANDLVRMANGSLREQAIAESDRNIAYLNQQALHTSLIEEQQAISYVLESEITKSMLARGNDQYAFKVLDPALASDDPSSFGPIVWGTIGLLLAALLWFVIVLLRLAWVAP